MLSLSSICSSFFRNASGTTAADATDSLDAAKSLEREDPSTALKIYRTLADKGDPEAMYRYGLMLLEGRGIKQRHFNTTVSYLGQATHFGHIEAKECIARIQNRHERLASILVKFERKGALTNEGIADDLQRDLVELMMEEKEGSPQERLTITLNDIQMALDDLISYYTDPNGLAFDPDRPVFNILQDYRKQICAEYQEHCANYQQQIFSSLLENGITQYGGEKGISIRLVTYELGLSEDLWIHLEQQHYTPIIHLNEVSKSYGEKYDTEIFWRARLKKNALESAGTKTAKEVFLTSPTLGKDEYLPCTKKGIRILKDRRITDSILIEKIRKGQYTLAEIDGAIERLRAFKQTHDHETNQTLNIPWVKARVIEGTLSLKLDKFTWYHYSALSDKEIQCFFQSEQHWQYIDSVASLSSPAARAFKNAWVRARITDGSLPWQKFTKMSEGGETILCNPQFQRLLDLPQNRFCIQQIAGFSHGGAAALKKKLTQGQLVDETEIFLPYVIIPERKSDDPHL